MSILFRCPCGRSMVVESDRSGSVVTCPNCKRALRVPSGKDRGVELAPVPAATKVRALRLCQRCRKEVPVDAQMCPHCKAILLDNPAAEREQAKAAVSGKAKGGKKKAASSSEMPLVYGGYRRSWWDQLSDGGKAGVIGGGVGGILVFAIILYVISLSGLGARLSSAREGGENVLKEGRHLENVGRFQEAYDQYSLSWRDKELRNTGQAADIQLADQIKARYKALHYIVPQPQLRTGESPFWKPKNDADLAQARSQLYASYGSYRSMGKALAKLGAEAGKFGLSTNDQAAYDARVGQVMDAYVNLVSQANEYQLATYTFQQVREGILYLTGANREWANTFQRKNSLLMCSQRYFPAADERFDMTTEDPGCDNFWPR